MEEIWKDIDGFEGKYQVSNLGRVKSVERTVWNKGTGCYMTIHERILKAGNDKDGYLLVNLYKDNKVKNCKVHRLVAQAFLPNPENLPDVNHKDENKTNNYIENLEWCSREYNNNFGTRNQRVTEKNSIPLIAINKVSGLILEFPSAHEAERVTGVSQSNITKCCKGKLKSCGGFYWYYADTEE